MTDVNFAQRNPCQALLRATVAATAMLVTTATWAASPPRYCSATAHEQFNGCGNEIADDLSTAQAICLNLSERDERSACREQARADHADGKQRCRQQRTAREKLCGQLGEARYDPHFDNDDFDDDFNSLSKPNAYRPLASGHQWRYAGDGETIAVEVRNETKLIDDVRCIVVRDTVERDGKLVEDTIDWLAQAKNGDVWYCGEEVKDYESFAGDSPELPELVSIAGSFKVGRDGAKAGILMPAAPRVGAIFRQEFAPGNAEDAFKVVSTNYQFGRTPQLDQFVPEDLARLLCAANDCIVTSDFTPIDSAPTAVERKYYARGIGMFFSVHEVSGKGVQLTYCNFDPRCAILPAP